MLFRSNFLIMSENLPVGLYSGCAGMALALSEGVNSGLLQSSPHLAGQIQQCFSRLADQPDLALGIAGQGLSLLRTMSWMEKEKAREILDLYVSTILSQQQANGCWDLNNDPRKKQDILTGIDRGVAGISWFLLACESQYPNKTVAQSIKRSLDWLMQNAKRSKNTYTWKISMKNQGVDRWTAGNGIPGIASLFIKAYSILREPAYKEIAKQILSDFDPRPVRRDFSLGSGLAGLGEIYLEAFDAFKENIWKERADWLAQVLIHSEKKTKDGKISWLPIMYDMTADLFTGTSGIIHFLLRHEDPGIYSHPLWL